VLNASGSFGEEKTPYIAGEKAAAGNQPTTESMQAATLELSAWYARPKSPAVVENLGMTAEPICHTADD